MHSLNLDALHVESFVVAASEPSSDPWPMITAVCSLWSCPISG